MGRQVSFPNLVAKTFGIPRPQAKRAIEVGGVHYNNTPVTDLQVDKDQYADVDLTYDGRTERTAS